MAGNTEPARAVLGGAGENHLEWTERPRMPTELTSHLQTLSR